MKLSRTIGTVVCCLFGLFIENRANGGREEDPRVINVLSLLPYADSNGLYGWDRGLELLPAARLAVKHVNDRTDVLPGYQMVLIERASDACGRSVVIRGLENFVGNALRPSPNDTKVIAVVGLACSTVTAAVSPIAGRSSILQVVMANSVALRNSERYPHLWRLISSSDVLVQATLSLMERFDWLRVGLVADGNGVFFQAIAQSFRQKALSRNYTLVVDEGIDFSPSIIRAAIERIKSQGVRIIFSSTTIPESVEIMCQAAKENLIWPGYVWIFPSRSYSDFMNGSAECDDREALINALDNVIFVDLEISGRDGNVTLVSGITYDQYRAEYDNEYDNVQMEYNDTDVTFSSVYNVYANAMYDEVWALALALNSSLDELEVNNFNLLDYQYGMPEITRIIEKHLKNTSFSGASTNVRFNEFNEVPTDVNIFQVRNKMQVLIGLFVENSLYIWNTDEKLIPGDDFETQYSLLHVAVVSELYCNAVIFLILITAFLIISFALRKEPEILAISPLLSILVYIGCYQLVIASVLTITHSFMRLPESAYITLCYLKSWSAQSGINFIATTILVRLVRVYRIFTHFGKTSKFWQDKYLFFVIIVIACLPDLITICSAIGDPIKVNNKEEYLLNKNPPVILVTPECRSDHGFSTIVYIITQIYTAILILLLLTFAILTRKVNKKNFKDTKKITVFIFLFTLVAVLSAVLSFLFNSNNRPGIANTVSSYSYQLMALMCLGIIIAPKAIPAFYYRVYKKQVKRSFHTQTEKDTTISKLVLSSLYEFKSRSSIHTLAPGSNYNTSLSTTESTQ